jgi:hypothetical protein
MKTTTTIILTILISFCFGQSTKTLKDSLFKKGDIVKIPTIIYGMSKPCCWPPQTDSIKPVADFLNKNKNLTIELGCYSDTRGDAKMNILLTSARAKSVWDYLVFELKVDSTRIKYKGYGENHLIISDKEILQAKTADEKQKLHLINQRTQLTILDIK